MARLKFREAINIALREEMRRDERVFLIGEDVGFVGGTYKATENLYAEFSENRVMDTPICENTFVGMAIGAAMAGLRPVVEIMSANFSLLAFDQLLNNAAKVRYMFGGQVSIPMVLRMPGGGSKQLAAQHSQALDAYFFHMPGLKVCCPSNPADAKGLLKAAIRDDDPVVFLEHEGIYSVQGDVPDDEDYLVPMGEAAVVRQGRDVTVVSWSNMFNYAARAVEQLEKDEGIKCTLIDLRTLNPLDTMTMLDAARQTKRVVIVEEGWQTGGVAAELAARIHEAAFDFLDAPVLRVGAHNTPTPYAWNLEQSHRPDVERIVSEIRGLVRG